MTPHEELTEEMAERWTDAALEALCRALKAEPEREVFVATRTGSYHRPTCGVIRRRTVSPYVPVEGGRTPCGTCCADHFLRQFRARRET